MRRSLGCKWRNGIHAVRAGRGEIDGLIKRPETKRPETIRQTPKCRFNNHFVCGKCRRGRSGAKTHFRVTRQAYYSRQLAQLHRMLRLGGWSYLQRAPGRIEHDVRSAADRGVPLHPYVTVLDRFATLQGRVSCANHGNRAKAIIKRQCASIGTTMPSTRCISWGVSASTCAYAVPVATANDRLPLWTDCSSDDGRIGALPA